jgi:hypothetical protein
MDADFLEPIIDAAADDIGAERDVVGGRAAVRAAIETAEIDVEVFGFGGPVGREGKFEARTDRPTRIGGARGQPRGGGVDVAECGAACDERQEVQSLPISGGSVTELSATDAWLGAVVDDGTYMGLVSQAYAARAAIVLTN